MTPVGKFDAGKNRLLWLDDLQLDLKVRIIWEARIVFQIFEALV